MEQNLTETLRQIVLIMINSQEKNAKKWPWPLMTSAMESKTTRSSLTGGTRETPTVKIMRAHTAMNRHRLIASLSSVCTSIAPGEEMSS